jgi:hypothetical protein
MNPKIVIRNETDADGRQKETSYIPLSRENGLLENLL